MAPRISPPPTSFCRARGFLVAADTRGGGDRVTSEPTRHCVTGVEATVAGQRRSDRVMLRRPAISHVTQTAKKHVRHRVCTSGFSKVSTQPQTVRERDSTCVPLPLVRSPSLRLDGFLPSEKARAQQLRPGNWSSMSALK